MEEKKLYELWSNVVRIAEEEEAAAKVRAAFRNPRPDAPTRRVVAYIRASHEEVAVYQEKRLRDYALLKGWEISEVRVGRDDDPDTAELAKRPDLRGLKDIVAADIDITGILVTNYGALASDADLYLELASSLEVEIVAMIEDAVYSTL